MKKNYKVLFYLMFSVCVITKIHAQTTTDAIMMKQRESCFALIYDHGSWDHYWEGTNLRTNATIATVSRSTVMPMITIGIHNKLNLIVSAPYVSTKSSETTGGKFQGAKGFQDIGLALKGELFNKKMGTGQLVVLSTIGFSAPMSNYLSDYMPYSLGLGTKEWSYRGIAEFKLDNGFFVRGMGAYLWRGQTKAERDFYYNDGSYYTPWMDVPSAWQYNAVIGMWFFENSLRVEASYTSLKSTSGDDIRKYNAPQPTNKTEMSQVGFLTQYYIKQLKGMGALAYYSHVINGRNVGKSTNFGIGLTYQFKI